jgi:hypothetical protein
MRMMKIRSNLPIKYYLGVYNEESISDEFTLLFEISQYLIRVAIQKEKEIDLDNFKFSSKSLKYVFGDKIKDETFKLNLVKSLKKLISEEYLRAEGDFMHFTKKGLTYFYQLND